MVKMGNMKWLLFAAGFLLLLGVIIGVLIREPLKNKYRDLQQQYEELQEEARKTQLEADSIASLYTDSLRVNREILDELISESEELQNRYNNARTRYNSVNRRLNSANYYIRSWSDVIEQYSIDAN